MKGADVIQITGALAGVCWAMVRFLRQYGILLTTPRRTRIAILLFSAAAGILAEVASGARWWQVIQIALAGPLAVALHELASGWRGKPVDADQGGASDRLPGPQPGEPKP